MRCKLAVLFFAIAGISCRTPRYVYAPSAQNIPNLEQKNDAEVSVNVGPLMRIFGTSDNYSRALDLQSAWALSDHFALMFNYANRWELDKAFSHPVHDSSDLNYRRSFVEPAVGFYSRISPSGYVMFQVFGGAGFGYSDITDSYSDSSGFFKSYHNSKITKVFLQPAIISKMTKNSYAALALRFTDVIFRQVNTNYSPTELDRYFLDNLEGSSVFFFEPSMLYAFGFEKVPITVKLQASLSILLNRRFYDYRSSFSSLGVAWQIRSKRKASRVTSEDPAL